jgi:glutaredoxin
MKNLLFIVLIFAVTGASAQLYRWVDQDGKVHYSDTPPPPTARNVEQKKFTNSVIETSQQPYEVQQTARNFPVTLYTASFCVEACNLSRALLTKRGVPFKEVVVADQEMVDTVKKISGSGQIPVLTVGRQVQVGFEAGTYDSMLDLAGYPKTAYLPAGAAKVPTPAQGADAAKTSPAGDAPAPAAK